MTTPATVPAVYAQALLDLAQEQDRYEQVVEEIHVLKETCDQAPEWLATLTAGGQPRALARGRLNELFAQHLSPILVNFLCLLSDRGRLAGLPQILATAVAMDEERRGVVRVTATTAIEADSAVRQRIEESLKRVVGAQTVVEWQVDDSLVAGMSLRYGDTLIDGSAQRRLADARATIRSAPLALVEVEEGDVA